VFRKEKPTSSAPSVETAAESAARANDAAQAAKGRPTPTRREAELARKQRLSGVGDNSKSAKRVQRARDYEITTERQHGGPVKQFARDYTDRRYRVAEFFIPLAVLMFVLATIRTNATQLASIVLWVIMLMAIIVDSVILVFGLKKAAKAKFPNQALGRLGLYALMRSLQFRRWRLPKPRLKRGEPI
jgi:hypothetical protein